MRDNNRINIRILKPGIYKTPVAIRLKGHKSEVFCINMTSAVNLLVGSGLDYDEAVFMLSRAFEQARLRLQDKSYLA